MSSGHLTKVYAVELQTTKEIEIPRWVFENWASHDKKVLPYWQNWVIVNASSSKNHAGFQYPAYFVVDIKTLKTNVKCLKVKYF